MPCENSHSQLGKSSFENGGQVGNRQAGKARQSSLSQAGKGGAHNDMGLDVGQDWGDSSAFAEQSSSPEGLNGTLRGSGDRLDGSATLRQSMRHSLRQSLQQQQVWVGDVL